MNHKSLLRAFMLGALAIAGLTGFSPAHSSHTGSATTIVASR